ncbi:MAG: dehydrogenase [Hyphomicrobiales bacterium]|nr:dehydrogenase [Hyphomicrobiales bacterium]
MKRNSPVLPESSLRDFVARLFVARGMSRSAGEAVARVLVWADLRGGDTHGVSRIAHYFGMIDKGALKPAAEPSLRVDFGALAAFDAQGAAGPVAMLTALDAAETRARAHGIGLALVGGATHAGAMGCYAEAAAREGFAALVIAAGPPLMAYHGARIPSVSTAPMAIAVPGGPDGVILLDMASSRISNGALKNAKRDGKPLPEGAALDAQGEATTDAAKADVLLPVGGPKGAGFALMVECLTSLLAGAPILSRMLGEGKKGHGQNATIILIDIARLRGPQDFTADVDALAEIVGRLPLAAGAEAIRLPGERGARLARERARDGVPVSPKIWAELVELAAAHNVAVPETA